MVRGESRGTTSNRVDILSITELLARKVCGNRGMFFIIRLLGTFLGGGGLEKAGDKKREKFPRLAEAFWVLLAYRLSYYQGHLVFLCPVKCPLQRFRHKL